MILSTIIGTKIAAVIASAVIAAGGLTGVGIAADNAAPGDTLYGLDCQMERIGLGDGGVQERVQEAAKLVQRGDVEAGLNHAALALRNQAGPSDEAGANGALVQAANAVQNAFRTANQGEAEQQSQLRTQTKDQTQTQDQTQDQTQTTEQSQTQLRTQTQDQTHVETSTSYQNQNGEGYNGGK